MENKNQNDRKATESIGVTELQKDLNKIEDSILDIEVDTLKAEAIVGDLKHYFYKMANRVLKEEGN